MLTTETNHQPPAPAELPPPFFDLNPWVWPRLVETITRQVRKTHHFLEKFTGRTSKNKAFNAGFLLNNVFEAAADYSLTSSETDPKSPVGLIRRDVETYLHESFAYKTPWYRYSPFGVDGSYQNAMDDDQNGAGRRFLDEQARIGASLTRPTLELAAMQELSQWMTDPNVPVGSQLIWISPRGDKPAYLGKQLDKPVKVNLYQKVVLGPEHNKIASPDEHGQVATLFCQFTIWTPNPDLADLQTRFLEAFEAQERWVLPPNNDTTTTSELLKDPDNQVIARFLTLSPEKSLQTPELESFLYENEDDWKINRADTPFAISELNWQEFEQIQELFIGPYLERVLEIAAEVLGDATDPDQIKTHPKYKLAIKTLDNMFGFMFASLHKVLETEAPEADSFVGLVATSQELAAKITRVQTILKSGFIKGQLSKLEIMELMQSYQLVRLSWSQALSLAACGGVAPFSAPLSAAKTLSGLRIGGLPIGTLELKALATDFVNQADNPAQALREIEEREYQLFYPSEPHQASHPFMVPANYLDGIGCAVLPDGTSVGPCYDHNRIEQDFPDFKTNPAMFENLSQAEKDPYRIPLDDPIEELALAMNESEFEQYLAAIKAELAEHQLQDIDALFSNSNLAETEKKQAAALVRMLTKLLIKESVSFGEFMNGQITTLNADSPEPQLSLPTEQLSEILTTTNIQAAFQKLQDLALELLVGLNQPLAELDLSPTTLEAVEQVLGDVNTSFSEKATRIDNEIHRPSIQQSGILYDASSPFPAFQKSPNDRGYLHY